MCVLMVMKCPKRAKYEETVHYLTTGWSWKCPSLG